MRRVAWLFWCVVWRGYFGVSCGVVILVWRVAWLFWCVVSRGYFGVSCSVVIWCVV